MDFECETLFVVKKAVFFSGSFDIPFVLGKVDERSGERSGLSLAFSSTKAPCVWVGRLFRHLLLQPLAICIKVVALALREK